MLPRTPASLSAVAALGSIARCLLAAGVLAGCGGATAESPPATPAAAAPFAQPTEAEVAQAQKPCGEADKVHTHDLNAAAKSETFVPCSKSGARDYSALVRMETLDQGVHIIIEATDDEVTLLGPEAKERDAVIVYPKGKGNAGVEVPLMKTKTGYQGDKIVLWEDLGDLKDEGTKIDVAIYDHDHSTRSTEELHLALAVSTGKSCERARDENVETLDMRKGLSAKADLSADQLGAPMRSSSFFASCGLPDSANADICVAVKKGKAVGVSVAVNPGNNRVAACIDRSARRLTFPVSDNLDVVHQKF
jgi:hypothetical protein